MITLSTKFKLNIRIKCQYKTKYSKKTKSLNHTFQEVGDNPMECTIKAKQSAERMLKHMNVIEHTPLEVSNITRDMQCPAIIVLNIQTN